jgi:hypothetical protein
VHVEHEYGQKLTKQFAKEDILGDKGSADNKKLKKGIETTMTLRSLPSSSPRGNASSKRSAPRTLVKPESRSSYDCRGNIPGGSRKPSDPSEVTYHRCKKGHVSNNCPSCARLTRPLIPSYKSTPCDVVSGPRVWHFFPTCSLVAHYIIT